MPRIVALAARRAVHLVVDGPGRADAVRAGPGNGDAVRKWVGQR